MNALGIMEDLPMELISAILLLCDDKTLSVVIPKVCKFFYNAFNDNSDIWKARCRSDRIDLGLKEQNETWKRFYYACNVKLFPLYGLVIGKSTREDLIPDQDIPLHTQMSMASKLARNTIQFRFDRNSSIFTRLNFTSTTKNRHLPPSWSKCGFTWDTSLEEYKKMLIRWTGNYTISRNAQGTRFDLSSVASEEKVFYLLQLVFKADDNGKKVLYMLDLAHVTNPNFIKRYKDRIIDESRVY